MDLTLDQVPRVRSFELVVDFFASDYGGQLPLRCGVKRQLVEQQKPLVVFCILGTRENPVHPEALAVVQHQQVVPLHAELDQVHPVSCVVRPVSDSSATVSVEVVIAICL